MQSVDIVIVSVFYLCIFCKKGRKSRVLRGCLRIEMPHITHKTHRNEAGFDGLLFSYQFLLYVMLKFAIERENSAAKI